MHEGKHGILDDVDEMDDLFGLEEENGDENGKNHGHDHNHDDHHDDHKKEEKK